MNTPDPIDYALTALNAQITHREGATAEDQLAVARMIHLNERPHLSSGPPSHSSKFINARKGTACVQEPS